MLLRRKLHGNMIKEKKYLQEICTRYDKYWCRMWVVVMGMDRNNVIEWEKGRRMKEMEKIEMTSRILSEKGMKEKAI